MSSGSSATFWGPVRSGSTSGRHERDMQPDDIRIVAPYNAQVARIREALESASVSSSASASASASAGGAGLARPTDRSVGTVDKFQGQEAPVVIYSMATSTPEDAPRGMEFLYSLNRLNVATSRARCAAIVVCSPLLVEPDCRTPRQMHLANALCRYRELAITASAVKPPPVESRGIV